MGGVDHPVEALPSVAKLFDLVKPQSQAERQESRVSLVLGHHCGVYTRGVRAHINTLIELPGISKATRKPVNDCNELPGRAASYFDGPSKSTLSTFGLVISRHIKMKLMANRTPTKDKSGIDQS